MSKECIHFFGPLCICMYNTHTHTHKHTHIGGMLQRTNATKNSFYQSNQDATTNAEEYYRLTQHARAYDVSGLPALIRASAIHLCYRLYGSVISLVQLSAYLCSVQKLNKLSLYYFYTYIFDFVLYFSCLNCCVGW